MFLLIAQPSQFSTTSSDVVLSGYQPEQLIIPLVIAAALSSFCYVELVSHCLSAGSAHHYSYICVGEVMSIFSLAWITGRASILEYTIRGSTVARGAVTALCSTLMAHSCLRYPIKEHSSGTIAATLAFVRDVKQVAGMRDDPHYHIRWFNKITSTLKYKNVPHEAIKLMLFPFSLEGQPGFGLKKNPLVLSLHGKISFLTAGDNLLNSTPRDALTIIENKSKVRTLRNKPVVSKVSATTSSSTPAYLPEITALTNDVKAMLLQNKTPSPAHVKAMEETCVICGGLHPYYECLAIDGNTFNAFAATGTYNQGGHGYCPRGETNYCARNQMRPPSFLQPNV
ncbi:hypothetical protein Tco_1134742 [Tanacetum coccineum]